MLRWSHMLAGLAALGATGCVGQLLETNPPKPRYLVGAVSGDALAGPTVDWSLMIENPGASRAYDTTKIAVSPTPGRIEYFSAGEWAGRAPVVFQMALIQSFEDSGRILAVGNRADIALADFALQSDLRRIDLDVSGSKRDAVLSVYARLTDGRAKVYAAKGFEARQPAASLSGDDVAAAFDAAFETVIRDIAEWTFEAGAAANIAESPGGS
ncbi:MAG: ABC-type transport auxiliary lipoprotein family protein [Pseudomonadota bacterium]